METAVLEKPHSSTKNVRALVRRTVTALALLGWLFVAFLGGKAVSPVTVIVFGVC